MKIGKGMLRGDKDKALSIPLCTLQAVNVAIDFFFLFLFFCVGAS